MAAVCTLPLAPAQADAFTESGTIDMPDLRQYPAGPRRKAAFFNLLIPIIQTANQRIADDRQWLMSARTHHLSSINDQIRLVSLCESYKVACDGRGAPPWDRLLERVNTVPMPLVLIQAVEESGWGTSRLARDGNNLFGLRCFGAECGMAQRGTSRRFQRFESIQASVDAYLNNLNTHRAYHSMRVRRATLVQAGHSVRAEALIPTLHRYSTRGSTYLGALRSLLGDNAALIKRIRDDQTA
ncbi:protein bax [Larsenimonas rhizosphaerae]|uniref:protein bax n=1 Tax=Larsenimonas rhizosphaerae TaxID=2944682 RepID=UPI002033803A|nr:protein bax [Larsenimonas rhizosphaerae]MCM2130564.1 protein bax [Larsenimonas rhizosphaerae]